MLDWGASDFGTDLGRCHFIGAVQNEEESIKVDRFSLIITEVCRMKSVGNNVNMTLSVKVLSADDVDSSPWFNSWQKPWSSIDPRC